MLQQALLNTYQNNLKYLQIKHPKVYENIINLSNAIEIGHYQEKFYLELKDNSYFDIFDIANNRFLYGKNSDDISQKIAQSIKYDNSGLNTLHKEFYNFDNITFAKNTLKENSDFLMSPDIIEYNTILNKKKVENPQFSDIHKFIFIGSYLGRHFIPVHKKIQAKSYLIIEPNLEIFRLSLFVVDLYELAKDSELFLIILDTDNYSMHDTIGKFYHTFNDLNYNIKYYIIDQSYQRYLEETIDILYKQAGFIFNYRLILRDLEQSYINYAKNFKFLHKMPQEKFKYKDKPILIIGPGPSLNEDTTWLQKQGDNFIIIALGSTLKKLHSLNIKPDIVVSADGNKSFVEQFKIDDKNYFKNIILFAHSNTHESILNYFQYENIFLLETVLKNLSHNFETINALTVGEITYSLALILGFTNIYLLGLDLAIDIESGSTHDNSYKSSKVSLESYDDNFYTKKNQINATNIIKIKGNLQNETFTTRKFYDLFFYYNLATQKYKKQKQTIFNLSKKGAFIEETIPKLSSDISLYEDIPKDFYTHFIIYLNTLSDYTLDNISLDDINNDLNFLENSKLNIQNLLLLNITNQSQLSKLFDTISQDLIISQSTNHTIKIIFSNYQNSIHNYLNYFIYQKDIHFSKIELNEIKRIYIDQILSIISCIEKYSLLIVHKKRV